jgi:DNA invertase Pin-like site-specific DNA recombinase
MLIGYARTSTLDQQAGLEAQLRDLESAGVEKVFSEQVSSVAHRKGLVSALDFLREGDTLVVTKLDRLARSTIDLLEIVQKLKRKDAHLNILSLGMDTNNAHGQLLLTVVGAIAQFERELMLERQREGIAKAKADGKYKGRKPTAKAKSAEVVKLKTAGEGASSIAKKLGIGRASVYRILNETKDDAGDHRT